MMMRALTALTLVATACASASPAAPARAVKDDELARIPGAPSEVAERILEDQHATSSRIIDSFMVVEVNLQSADNERVRTALAVLEAMATSIDSNWIERMEEEEGILDGIRNLVDHVREILGQRLRTAPCSLVFAVEHAAGRFGHLPGYVPIMASHPPTRRHVLSLHTRFCAVEFMKAKVAACDPKHGVPADATVDIVVGKEGAVTSAVTTGRLANTRLGDCVAAAVRTVTLPVSDEVTTLTYPRY
jgi:hypothetical protein